jgi:hypothetical protein
MPIVNGGVDALLSTLTLKDDQGIFTPPAYCFGPTFTISPQGYDVATSHKATPNGYLLSRGLDPACYPIGFQSGVVYSPAGCPKGHTGAQTNINTHGDITVTGISCCPV